MSPRVAIIGSRGFPSFYGGFETLVRELVPYLAERSWHVDVYCRGDVPRELGDLDSAVTQRFTFGVDSRSISTLSFGLTACADTAIRKPDVALVLNVANGYWLPMLRARNIPTVVNVDGIEWERAKWGSFAQRVFYGGAKLTAKFGTTLVSDSREIAKYWEENFGRSSEFIPYGGTAPSQIDSSLQLSDLEPGGYVLIVARFVPENTVAEFFDAAEVLARRTKVVIVGSSGYGGSLDERARRLAATNPNIQWHGHIRDDDLLFALWANAGAYFHGHSVGGTNPALVQAMACGAPVVARDTPFNREVLGDAAEFAEPDARVIASAVERLLDEPAYAKELGVKAFERQQSEYTWGIVCRGYDRVLAEAAGLR